MRYLLLLPPMMANSTASSNATKALDSASVRQQLHKQMRPRRLKARAHDMTFNVSAVGTQRNQHQRKERTQQPSPQASTTWLPPHTSTSYRREPTQNQQPQHAEVQRNARGPDHPRATLEESQTVSSAAHSRLLSSHLFSSHNIGSSTDRDRPGKRTDPSYPISV